MAFTWLTHPKRVFYIIEKILPFLLVQEMAKKSAQNVIALFFFSLCFAFCIVSILFFLFHSEVWKPRK